MKLVYLFIFLFVALLAEDAKEEIVVIKIKRGEILKNVTKTGTSIKDRIDILATDQKEIMVTVSDFAICAL